MTDHASFYRAIRADPAADTSRLVFADWLDDHGDPAWAELVRVQIELEPIHEQLDHPRRKLLADRETELLAVHADRWLGPAKDIAAEYPAYGPVFRRGLPESVSLSLDAFLSRGAELFAACPTVREVCVYGVAGRGAELAGCPHLAYVETLEVADWLTADDVRPIVSADPPGGLGLLRLWLGPWAVESGSSLFRSARPSMGVLELVELVSFRRYDDDGRDDGSFDLGVLVANQSAGRERVRVVRPDDRPFPLDGDLGHGLVAGRLADGTAALIAADGGGYTLTTFRDDGLSVGLRVADRPAGFAPGPVRVRVAWTTAGPAVRRWPRAYVRDYLTNPFDRPAGVTDRWWADRGGVLKRWLHDGRFVVEWDGREFWLDASGTVVSS